MKAAWDWHLPRKTHEDEKELVAFVAGLGFDTLVVNSPSPNLVAAGGAEGLKVVAVVHASVDAEQAKQRPEILQQTLPEEVAMEKALAGGQSEDVQRMAHRWFPLIQRSNLLCYEQQGARELLCRRVSEALETADGVAFDGFGFKNHYACFCPSCSEAHRSDPATIAQFSEESLIHLSKVLYDHAKTVDQDSIVMNHVWPPFNPNPYYASKLYLDFCTQTISWFYRPCWSIERVELEAADHKKLEDPGRNRFVPFLGLYSDPYQRRSAERLDRELDIGLRYGEGSIVLCTMQGPAEDPEIREIIRRRFGVAG